MKYLKINLIDRNESENIRETVFGSEHSKVVSQVGCNINKDEFPNIYYDEEITQEALDDAIDTLLTYFMQNEVNEMKVDLALREHEYAKENGNCDYEEILDKLEQLSNNIEDTNQQINHIKSFINDCIKLSKED